MPEGLSALGPFFAVSFHPPHATAVHPWRPVDELTSPSGALQERLAAVRAALATSGGVPVDEVEPRVAASALHLGIAARLTAPALGAAVLRCPIDMHPDGVWWQDALGGPVPLSVPALRSDRQLTDHWADQLVDDLLAPIAAAIAGLVPMSARVLRGNVASAVNAGAATIARQRPDLAADAWQAARRFFTLPALRGEQHPPGLAFRRSSCCLFYRLAPGSPSAICGDCILGQRRDR